MHRERERESWKGKRKKTSLNDAAKFDTRAADLRNKIITKLKGTLAGYQEHDGIRRIRKKGVIPALFRQITCLSTTRKLLPGVIAARRSGHMGQYTANIEGVANVRKSSPWLEKFGLTV